MIKISPSLLASNFSILSKEIKDIEDSGADMLHIDVMDGVFVTNISFGFPIIDSIRSLTDMVFDTHLMITKPERYIERFIDAGSDIVTFHIEATDKVEDCLDMIRNRGKRAGLSIKPGTPAEVVYPYLEKCDMILVMTVEPGYGGQALIPETLDKVRAIRAYISERGYDIDIQVDGGIKPENAKATIEAGANILVAGSSVFKAQDRRAAVDALR